MVVQERAKPTKALNEALPYQREQLTTVMRQFIESKRAYSEFGKVYIDSLVVKNLVHLRPGGWRASMKCFLMLICSAKLIFPLNVPPKFL